MLADYLKLLKNKKNLTNQELADLSGVPVGTINRIMAGQTDNPNFKLSAISSLRWDGRLARRTGGIPPRSEIGTQRVGQCRRDAHVQKTHFHQG